MRYLVTGGAGFIGSHLVDELVARGDEVVVLDDLSTGSSANLNPAARFVQGSILDAGLVADMVGSCDIVVHLAAAVGVRRIVERPLDSFITNIRGTETVLDACHRHGRKVFIASSSEIYGKTRMAASREDDDRITGDVKLARWGYATSKTVDETLAFAYQRELGVPVVIARFFNTVGPRQTDAYGMVVPTFVRQALDGRPVTVFGDGAQTRCFCHVSDVVRAVLALLEEEQAEGDVFNVGTTEEIAIADLARRVIMAAGSASEMRFVPYEEAYGEGFEDMARRIPDTTRIRTLVGWEPTRDLQAILDEMVVYERAQRDNRPAPAL